MWKEEYFMFYMFRIIDYSKNVLICQKKNLLFLEFQFSEESFNWYEPSYQIFYKIALIESNQTITKTKHKVR